TTITEQLLLFGGVVRKAGTVKAKKSGNFAKSDWMEIEKKRGISVTSSVMQFDYAGKRVNILDTPGRSEEHTSELQSRFDLVCRPRHLPAFPTRRSSDLDYDN